MTKFRVVVPIALAASAIAVFLASEAFRERESTSPEISSAGREEKVSPPPSQGPVYDDQGREVFILGQTGVHIPASQNPSATVADPPEARTVQVTLCWPPPEEGAKCPSVKNLVGIFLHGQSGPPPTIEDSMANLQRRLKASEGPIETRFDEVWAFRHPPTGKVFNYALSKPDSTGRHAIARCTNGPRCRVSIHVRSGVYAGYEFGKDHLDIWPQIDHQVRQYVTSFIVEG